MCLSTILFRMDSGRTIGIQNPWSTSLPAIICVSRSTSTTKALITCQTPPTTNWIAFSNEQRPKLQPTDRVSIKQSINHCFPSSTPKPTLSQCKRSSQSCPNSGPKAPSTKNKWPPNRPTSKERLSWSARQRKATTIWAENRIPVTLCSSATCCIKKSQTV